MENFKIKNFIKITGKRFIKGCISNLYSKPKLVIKTLRQPGKLFQESYFPELERKSKLQIFVDQISNIIVHGSIDEYYYMYGLDVKRDVKRSDYVIYLDFLKARDHLNLSNPHNDSTLLRNKFFFESVASSIGISTPEVVAYSNNGILIPLHQEKNLDWTNLPDGIFYIKPIDGECGNGIIKVTVQDNKIESKGQLVDANAIAERCQHGRYIIQRNLRQHPEMSRIYPNSVNTIRMTTVRNPKTGEIEVLPPTLRIGAHGSFVDNFSQGGVIVAMDTETGNLADWGFFKPKYGFKSKEHPDTKIPFSSFKVPFYQEAKRQAILFHSFLNLHSIGWDIAISENGPVFIEGNDNWEINLPQTFDNPFKKEFLRLFKN